MPRHSKVHEQALSDQTLVLDNGAYTMKAGFASPSPSVSDCVEIPNCIAKDRERTVYIGADLDTAREFGEIIYRRPVEKGCLVSWEAEKEIWDHSFFGKSAKLQCDPHSANLLLTEAPNVPATLQSNCDQIVFEEYEFAAYHRCTGPSLNAYNDIALLFKDPTNASIPAEAPAECVLVVDSGFSHSTVTPVYRGRPIQQAIRRLDIGGKFLTNYMKEVVSIRHTNMMDDTHIMNQVKEDVCFVSKDLKADLERVWKGRDKLKDRIGDEILVDYVLPDFTNYIRGFRRPHDPQLQVKRNKYGAVQGANGIMEAVMTIGNERFTVPELLFHPADIGMKVGGLPEVVLESMYALPQALQAAMLSNILVIGGNVKLQNFTERLTAEIRQLAPAEVIVRVVEAPDPIKSTWLGGARLAANRQLLKEVMVTRQDYQEYGTAWLSKKFASGKAK